MQLQNTDDNVQRVDIFIIFYIDHFLKRTVSAILFHVTLLCFEQTQ